MPYLFDRDDYSVDDADSHLASNLERVPPPRMEEQPGMTHDFVEAVPMESSGEETRKPEQSSPPAETRLVPEKQVESGTQLDEEPERIVEERVLAYRAQEGGHSFSKIESLQEADLVAGFDGTVVDEEEDEESKKKRKDKKSSQKSAGGDGGVASVSQSKVPAGAKSKTSGENAATSLEANVEQEKFTGQVATATESKQSPSAVPAPGSRLRSRVGSNGRVFVGGGWYSNGAAGNVKGLVGGTQSPTMTQPVRIDARETSGVSFDGNSRVTGLPEGVESGGPVGFRSVIQNTASSPIQGGSLTRPNAGIRADSTRVVIPPTSDLSAPGTSGGGVDLRGIDTNRNQAPLISCVLYQEQRYLRSSWGFFRSVLVK